MTLPENFKSWEHLQDVWRRIHNRRVREHFSDLADPGSEWDAEIETARGSLRVACMMDDNDTADMLTIRTLLFWLVLGQSAALQTPVYGIPIPSFQEARKFRPQIQLYFKEDLRDIEPGYAPVTGEISVRLMNESSSTLSESELNIFAQRVRTAFSTAQGFVWQKGKVMCSYVDRSQGYQLQLLCRSKTEGRRVIEQVLDLQQHSPDWKYLNVSENEAPTQRFPTIPGNDFILGRSRRRPRSRPVADVRFQYAVMHVHGLPHPIVLIDRSGTFRNPLITA